MSTLYASEKSNQWMLPKSRAIESMSADRPGAGITGGVETVVDAALAGVKHDRGGKNAGPSVGRVTVRARGRFNIQTGHGLVTGISFKYCKIIQRSDRWSYSRTATITDATA